MRLADLLAGLSRLADLGFGLHAGEALRSCALATKLAWSLDLPDDDVRAALYTSLLHHVGCTGYAHETARIFGDELALNAAAARHNQTEARDLFATFLPMLTRGRPPLDRARLAFTRAHQRKQLRQGVHHGRLRGGAGRRAPAGMPEAVQRSVYHVYELWRGGGAPAGLRGEDIPLASWVARLTGIAALFDTVGERRPQSRQSAGAAAACWTRTRRRTSPTVRPRCSTNPTPRIPGSRS